MDLNVIKEYLIGIGFKLNEDSYNQFQQTMKNAEGNIKNFANNNKDNMSSLQKFFQLFNGSLKDNMGIIAKILPETKAPFLQLIAFIELLHKGVNKVSTGFKGIKTDTIKGDNVKKASETMEELSKKTKETQSPFVQLIELVKILNIEINKLSYNLQNIKTPNIPEVDLKQTSSEILIPKTTNTEKENFNPVGLVKTSQALGNVSKESDEAKKSFQILKEDGGKALEDLGKKSKISLGLMAGAFAGVAAVAIGLWKTLTNLAKQDLGYQKLAMQLWTTTENAREVDMALKTMKISMQDLWLSPELLQQFNQLRQDAANLKLPPDYENNLKLVRSVVFEFQRLKQAVSLVFQWIGYYISKYAAGPLAELHQSLHNFVDWILKNIPNAAKVIGTILGIALRLILDLLETIGHVIRPIVDGLSLFVDIFEKMPGPLKAIIALVIALQIALATGPLGVLFLIIAALDDIYTFFRGGKSVTGDFLNGIKKGGIDAVDTIIKKFKSIRDVVMEPFEFIKKEWNKLEDYVKNSAIGKIVNKLISILPEASSKVKTFSNTVSSNKNVLVPYIYPQSNNVNTKNSTMNNTNHNNTTNNFNIYGTTPTGTANAIDSKLNKTKTSILTRNLGGIY